MPIYVVSKIHRYLQKPHSMFSIFRHKGACAGLEREKTKGFSTSILMEGDQGASLLWNPSCGDQGASLPRNLGWLKGFSISILNYGIVLEDLFMEICPLKICSQRFFVWRFVYKDLSFEDLFTKICPLKISCKRNKGWFSWFV